MAAYLLNITLPIVTAVLLASSCSKGLFDPDANAASANGLANQVVIEKLSEFNSCYDTLEFKDSFLFFTDPHIFPTPNVSPKAVSKRFSEAFSVLRNAYESLPMDFCLCGGDWLTRGDFQQNAKEKLEYASSRMNEWFAPYYPIFGNHDTNYHGTVSEADSSRGDLPYEYVNGVLFKDFGKAYYSFKENHTRFYILDTGIDWNQSMDEYRWEQFQWLASNLASNKDGHIAIAIHMYFASTVAENNPMVMSRILTELCGTFNNRGAATLNGAIYDFSNAEGKVHFILAGHNHIDFQTAADGIPVVGTTKLTGDHRNSFDLCIADYDNMVLRMFRIGDGENRIIKI